VQIAIQFANVFHFLGLGDQRAIGNDGYTIDSAVCSCSDSDIVGINRLANMCTGQEAPAKMLKRGNFVELLEAVLINELRQELLCYSVHSFSK